MKKILSIGALSLGACVTVPVAMAQAGALNNKKEAESPQTDVSKNFAYGVLPRPHAYGWEVHYFYQKDSNGNPAVGFSNGTYTFKLNVTDRKNNVNTFVIKMNITDQTRMTPQSFRVNSKLDPTTQMNIRYQNLNGRMVIGIDAWDPLYLQWRPYQPKISMVSVMKENTDAKINYTDVTSYLKRTSATSYTSTQAFGPLSTYVATVDITAKDEFGYHTTRGEVTFVGGGFTQKNLVWAQMVPMILRDTYSPAYVLINTGLNSTSTISVAGSNAVSINIIDIKNAQI